MFGHAFVAFGAFEGAFLAVVVHHVVDEQGGHLGPRLQVELVGFVGLLVAPKSERLVWVLCLEPHLQTLEIL